MAYHPPYGLGHSVKSRCSWARSSLLWTHFCESIKRTQNMTRTCTLCPNNKQDETTNHLFNHQHELLLIHPNTLTTFLSDMTNRPTATIALWAIWKTRCKFKHLNDHQQQHFDLLKHLTHIREEETYRWTHIQ